MKHLGLAVSLSLSLSLAIAPSEARADDVDACIAAADAGQAARRKSALGEARKSFIRCSDDACPAQIRADCVRWLDDVDARMPSIAIRIEGSDGAPMNATVKIDGAALPTSDDGRAIALDPGAHVILVEAAGFVPNERRIVLFEGERARVIAITMTADAPAPLAPASPPSAEPAPPPRLPPPATTTPTDERPTHRTSPVVWALGGVGVAALASFAFFGLTGKADAADLRSGCGATRTCDPTDVDDVRAKYLAADVSAGIAIVALGVATAIWLVDR